MREKIRILLLSSNPSAKSAIFMDEEARVIFEQLQAGPYRDRFQIYSHAALCPGDIQKLLLLHVPHVVHFSGDGRNTRQIKLRKLQPRGKLLEQRGLTNVFALYNTHLRLVLLNGRFTKAQARSVSQVINYSIGAGKGFGDEACATFVAAFYRALAFGKSVRGAFASAKAELALTKLPRSRGIQLFIRHGVSERDRFPRLVPRASETARAPSLAD